MRFISFLLASLLAGSVQAAPGPDDPATQFPGSSLRADDLRVLATAYRLALGGRPVCPSHHPLTGLLLHHLAEYAPADRTEAVARYHLDRGPGVLAVVPDSPAARAGLIAGDVLLAVNGTTFAAPTVIAAEPERKRWRQLIEASEGQLDSQLRHGPARLRVLRADAEIELTIEAIPACLARVRLARSRQLNAFADGNYVIATTALLDFLLNENELAVVLAHEMSHNILGHPATLEAQGVPKDGMLRSFGINAKRVWTTEAAADRLGIELVWRAGFDVTAAIPFWRRLHASRTRLPQIFRTHPSLKAREKIVREAIAALPVQGAPQ